MCNKRSNIVVLLFLGALILIIAGCWGTRIEDPCLYTIDGRVHDSQTMNPVDSVMIDISFEIERYGGPYIINTDSTGFFWIGEIGYFTQESKINLTFSKTGYQTKIVELMLIEQNQDFDSLNVLLVPVE